MDGEKVKDTETPNQFRKKKIIHLREKDPSPTDALRVPPPPPSPAENYYLLY
jgi:hypothetical protein